MSCLDPSLMILLDDNVAVIVYTIRSVYSFLIFGDLPAKRFAEAEVR